MRRPAREATVCLKTTTVALREVSTDAALLLVISELESIFIERRAENDTKGFSQWKTCSALFPTGLGKSLIYKLVNGFADLIV